jgi:lipid II:glycine glycyltransferase (peptidoglycan interpeptide bridge formation enzyme)
MELKTIADRNLFDSFVMSHPYCHYMKTSMWGEFKKHTEKMTYEMKGFYVDTVLVATAMILRGSYCGHSYLYVPKGLSIDYEDPALYKEAFSLLKDYADSQKVLFLRTDPDVVRVPRDIKGNQLEGFNHESVTKDLQSIGYTHKGYGYGYDGSWNDRYTLIVDLHDDMDTVVSRFSKQRLTALNRHVINHVSTHVGTKKDIPYLMEYEQHLCWHDGFAPHSSDFFTSLMDCFGEHAVLYVTEIDLDGMIEGITQEISGKKYKKDIKAKNDKEKEIVWAKQMIVNYGHKLPIAVGLFLRMQDTSWDLYTYNHKDFTVIRAVDNLHRFAMEDMKAHGVVHYDMVGFSGLTTKDDAEYGLYIYKSSFSPTFTEYLGEFDYIRNESAMKHFRFENYAFKRLKREIKTRIHRKKASSEDYIKLAHSLHQ